MQEGQRQPDYKVDHLFLLIGGNPLPNAIAATCLAKPDANVYLVHTDAPGSIKAKDSLVHWLVTGEAVKDLHLNPQPVQVSDGSTSMPCAMEERLASVLRGCQTGAVGINYTGGKKIMSVYGYRCVSAWARRLERKDKTVSFSYVDADSGKMVIQYADETVHTEDLPRFVISLPETMKLHGWDLRGGICEMPVFADFARELVKLNVNGAGKQWADWKRAALEQFRPRGDWLPDDDDEYREKPLRMASCRHKCPDAAWKHLVGGDTTKTCTTIADAVGALGGGVTYSELCAWLDGKWLEHCVLDCLLELKEKGLIDWCGANIETGDPRFEVDAAAVKGYQLFAFSCGTSTYKAELKRKLFEAYHRARQLGGDQSRVALVCPYRDRADLQREMRTDIAMDPGSIRVFGLSDLPKLKDRIAGWLREQSR